MKEKNLNERIDKLLVDAGAYFGGDGVVYDTFDPKKFAVMIIKRCRDIVSDTRDQAIEEEWNVDEAMSTAMYDIEEHFGVK